MNQVINFDGHVTVVPKLANIHLNQFEFDSNELTINRNNSILVPRNPNKMKLLSYDNIFDLYMKKSFTLFILLDILE